MQNLKNSNWYKICLLSFILITIVAVIFILSVTYTYAATNDDLKGLMYQYCEEQLGYTKDALELYNFVQKTEGGWAFSLKVKDADPTTNGLVIGEMAEDGQLVSLEGPTSISVFEQLREALLSSERSYEAMYQLKLEWEPKLDQLSDDDLAELNLEWLAKLWPFIPLLHHDIRLPADGDISYEEAQANAEKAILALPEWTQEMLDCMAIRLVVYHVPENSSTPVYQFVYGLASSVHVYDYHYGEPAISESTYDKLSENEDRVFGDVEPCFVSVRINAQTGEVAGDIIIETPPTTDGAPEIYILWE